MRRAALTATWRVDFQGSFGAIESSQVSALAKSISAGAIPAKAHQRKNFEQRDRSEELMAAPCAR
jgi:hypothetical protein